MPPVELFMTDFCPFAQRAWIAFLEKESDPEHPKLFNYREVRCRPSASPLPASQPASQPRPAANAGPNGGGEAETRPEVEWRD